MTCKFFLFSLEKKNKNENKNKNKTFVFDGDIDEVIFMSFRYYDSMIFYNKSDLCTVSDEFSFFQRSSERKLMFSSCKNHYIHLKKEYNF